MEVRAKDVVLKSPAARGLQPRGVTGAALTLSFLGAEVVCEENCVKQRLAWLFQSENLIQAQMLELYWSSRPLSEICAALICLNLLELFKD